MTADIPFVWWLLLSAFGVVTCVIAYVYIITVKLKVLWNPLATSNHDES